MKHQGRMAGVGVLLAMSLLAVACGDDGSDSAEEEGAGAGGQVAEADATTSIPSDGEPQRGGTLVELVTTYEEDADPVTKTNSPTHEMVGLAYSRLLAFRVGEGIEYGEKELEGDLAESWEVAEDGLTYTFRLRDGVVFHDIPPVSGRPLRAADVVSTMNRIKSEGVADYMLSSVASVEAPDDRTVVFRLSAPFAPLLNYLASHYMWILPEEANTGVYDPSVTVIGTGPFILEDRQSNVHMTYRANPDYYGEGPYIDGIRRLVVPDQGAKIAAFRAGEADVIPGPPPGQTGQVLDTTPGAVELTLLAPTHLALYMNQLRPPLDDARVREAMSLAIDRKGLSESVFGGGIYSGPVVGSLGKWALPQEELAELYPHDPERARELLAEAGVEDLRLTINASAGYGDQVVRANQWVAQDLADVGITAEIQMMDYAAQIRSLSGDFDITINPQTPYVEADEWLRAQLYPGLPRNRFGVDDPQLNRMLEEQLVILDEDERVEAVHDIQRYVADHMLGFIPVWDYVATTLVSSRVRDYYPDPLYGSYEYRLIWLDQG